MYRCLASTRISVLFSVNQTLNGQLLLKMRVFIVWYIITGAQPKAGTGHKMQTVSVVFSTLHC